MKRSHGNAGLVYLQLVYEGEVQLNMALEVCPLERLKIPVDILIFCHFYLDAMRQMKQVLPYEISSLTWIKNNKLNTEEVCNSLSSVVYSTVWELNAMQ